MLRSFRRIRTQMLRAGLFKSSKSFYAWKLISLLGMYCTVAGILMNGQNTWFAALAAAFTLALAWQQSGWLAHDFLHHQVFENRSLNTAFGYFIGNCLQGFSVDWWKSKHNTHHAVPNECTGDAVAVDPGKHLSLYAAFIMYELFVFWRPICAETVLA
jgi:acyl-lipid Delta6-acetylenase / acyl-lipid (9-3)-desaturase